MIWKVKHHTLKFKLLRGYEVYTTSNDEISIRLELISSNKINVRIIDAMYGFVLMNIIPISGNKTFSEYVFYSNYIVDFERRVREIRIEQPSMQDRMETLENLMCNFKK